MRLAEKFLYHIWDAQHLRNELRTVSGKTVLVKFHGRWNTGKGADFKNAILEIEGKTFQGDIEIHYESYDWKAHHHQEDPNFNTVILHVVYVHQQKKQVTIKENSEAIEILELHPFLDNDIAKLLTIYEDKEFREREHLCHFFSGLDSNQTKKCLLHFGKERFIKKAKRFGAELDFVSYDQLLYQGIMEALGYSKNKFQMLQLAQHIPFDLLQKWHSSQVTPDEMVAIMLGASGLLTKLPSTFPADLAGKWKEMFATQTHFRIALPINWEFFRIRPQNHPSIRIIQMVYLLYDCLNTSFLQKFSALFSFPKDDFHSTEFRQRFYRFFREHPPSLPVAYSLGNKRLDVILINIVLPIIKLFAQKHEYSDLEKAVDELYENYPGLLANSIVTHMETGMEEFQKKMIRCSAVLQQGVIELYFSYCEYRMCELCHLLKQNLISRM